jgi:hypothetical protein
MDASMRQKVALTAAHLLGRGKVADMGMGSGAGSQALAALYPDLAVVGVDVDPAMVERARVTFREPNLSFVVGDIAEPVFPDASLDGVFDSSVLHHVTSFGDYRHERAATALAVQARQLVDHGALVVRDFVDPGDGDVLLDVPADDGDDCDDPRRCSTAALLVRFAGEFRSLSKKPGFEIEAIDAAKASPTVRPGWRRYRMSHKNAVELVLRKDYRTDWEAEVQEEYTYFTQAQFEATFARLGLRVLASTPIHNPWIVRNRFEGRCELRALDGAVLDFPATNYLIAGEKVARGAGVRFREGATHAPVGYLQTSCWRDKTTGHVFDVVRRPNVLLDVVPFFEDDGDLFVVARMSYPRPILSCAPAGEDALDGSRPAAYVTEPLNVPQTSEPRGTTVEAMLRRSAGIPSADIVSLLAGGTYYPSPGGIQEDVRSVLVRVTPRAVEDRVDNLSGFSTSGRVRAIEARQVLRAAQVNGLPSARLELGVHELLARLELDPGPWIGEAVDPGAMRGALARTATFETLASHEGSRRFEAASAAQSRRFLELRCSTFEELDADGRVIASRPLEWVVPGPVSATTLALAPIARHGGELWLGIDEDHRPAAQCLEGNSDLLVAPAWRLPRTLRRRHEARAWVLARLAEEYGVEPGRVWELGGSYHPSPTVSPEVVLPLAVEIVAEPGAAPRRLCWVPLRDVRRGLRCLKDGHLRVVALRAAHALGLLAS